MSELKTNKISTNDQNNVAIDNALGLKSYTEAQRDALTAVAGDVVYNNENGTIDFYNGSAWFSTSDNTFQFEVSSLVIAGGGGGARSVSGPAYGNAGGGGAGGYRNSYATESSGANSSTETPLTLTTGVSYSVTIGGGGSKGISGTFPNNGSNSIFSTITSTGGGAGGSYSSGEYAGKSGGSAGGSTWNSSTQTAGTPNQGMAGGRGFSGTETERAGGGGGGAGAVGANANANNGGDGGAGLSSSITGSSVARGGGGAGGRGTNSGGTGGGGGNAHKQNGTDGTSYTGGGGGAGSSAEESGGSFDGGNGGSGVVILSYPSTKTITLTGGASSTDGEQTEGSRKYIQIETSGTVSWA